MFVLEGKFQNNGSSEDRSLGSPKVIDLIALRNLKYCVGVSWHLLLMSEVSRVYLSSTVQK